MSPATDYTRPIDLLLVEDSPGDVRLTQEGLKESSAKVKLHDVPDGVEALKFLNREAPYADAPRPDLILLDLNMPKKDGREVLAELRGSDKLKGIPVIVLTTSNAQEDVRMAYMLCANCFITKPLDFDQFVEVIRTIEKFWLKTVELPPR